MTTHIQGPRNLLRPLLDITVLGRRDCPDSITLSDALSVFLSIFCVAGSGAQGLGSPPKSHGYELESDSNSRLSQPPPPSPAVSQEVTTRAVSLPRAPKDGWRLWFSGSKTCPALPRGLTCVCWQRLPGFSGQLLVGWGEAAAAARRPVPKDAES